MPTDHQLRRSFAQRNLCLIYALFGLLVVVLGSVFLFAVYAHAQMVPMQPGEPGYWPAVLNNIGNMLAALIVGLGIVFAGVAFIMACLADVVFGGNRPQRCTRLTAVIWGGLMAITGACMAAVALLM